MREPLLYSLFMDNVDRKANLSKEPKLSELLFSQLDRQQFNLKLEEELEKKSTKENSEARSPLPITERGSDSPNENSSLEDVISKAFVFANG